MDNKQKNQKSLLVCGYCGNKVKDYKDISKVYQSGYADMLCWACKDSFEDAITRLAIKYLNN